jgi:exonuclease III
MKLASWNINSVRLRQALVFDRLQGLDLDVLCPLEIKTEV